MKVEPIVLEGRVLRLEPLAEEHAEQLAEAATPEIFAYHFPPAELTAESFREQIRGLRMAPGWCPFAQVLRHAFETLGAVREGVLRRHMILPDGFVRDTVMFSIVDREWPGVRDALEQRLAAL